ncbi:MAG: hypothetical protein IPF82_15600 [Blastocatellia bacterium]|nr:hypothetical protein [Blastocatellia bacterium]
MRFDFDIRQYGHRRAIRVLAFVLFVPWSVSFFALPSAGSIRAAVLSVRVVDESGAIVVGSTVTIAETGENRANLLLTTDAAGRAQATVPDGTYAVTVFPPSTSGPATELVRATTQGIAVDSNREVEILLRRGIPLQTCVRSEDGRPLPGARVDVFSPVFDLVTTTYTDETGWIRIVATSDQWLFVAPLPDGGLEIGGWVRVEDTLHDSNGLAAPIVLGRLAPPTVEADGIIVIHRGASTSGRIRIAILSEGYTDGNEAFDDRNRNGRCDDEPFLDLDGDGRHDPNEPFADANLNGRRDSEPFTDANGDGVCNRDERAAFLRAITDDVRMMLAYPVYRELADRIEVVAAFLPSPQAGSDFPSLPNPIVRDTMFDSRFASTNYIFNLDRSKAEFEGIRRFGEFDVLGVLTNSLFKLGRESASGTLFLFGSPQAETTSTLAHEIGHAIGKLGDEYFEYDSAPPYSGNEPVFPNLTKTPDRDALKWSRFVRSSTSVPTADGSSGVGAFEGAYYRRRGVYRPSHSCLMRRYGPFCPVCTDAMLTRSYNLVETSRPAEPVVVTPRNGATVSGWMTVGAIGPDVARIVAAEVLVDGTPAGEPVREMTLGLAIDTSKYTNGAHAIAIAITEVDGIRRTTAPVTVVVSNESRLAPSIGTPEYRGGAIVFPQASGVVMPGAVAIVNGKDRFPIEVTGSGVVRTVKSSLGSASRLRVAKAVPKRRDVSVRIVNASGGQSDVATFRR